MSITSKVPGWLCVTIWILLGYAMIIFNKCLLSTWGFSFPFFLTTWHCFLGTVLTQILSRTTNWLPGVAENKVSLKDFFRKIVPMALFFAYGLVAGNVAYRYLSLSYIQMVKSITPVPLLLLSFAAGREKPSLTELIITLIVCSGVIMSSVGELKFSMFGFIMQFSAVISDCCRILLLDILLKDLALDSLSLLYYMAPVSTVAIGFGFLLFESATFPALDVLLTPMFTFMLVSNGLLAFSLNLAVFLVIGNTSAVVLSLCGPIKDIALVVSSLVMFGAPITLLQVFGFSVSICGLLMYRHHKSDPQGFHATLGQAVRTVLSLLDGSKSKKEKEIDHRLPMVTNSSGNSNISNSSDKLNEKSELDANNQNHNDNNTAPTSERSKSPYSSGYEHNSNHVSEKDMELQEREPFIQKNKLDIRDVRI